MMANCAGMKSDRIRKVWSANDFLPPAMRRKRSESVVPGKITDLKVFLPRGA